MAGLRFESDRMTPMMLAIIIMSDFDRNSAGITSDFEFDQNRAGLQVRSDHDGISIGLRVESSAIAGRIQRNCNYNSIGF